jgi:hypothetical protein
MCFDAREWRQRALLRKHLPGPFDRRDEVIQKSLRRSMFFVDVDVVAAEREAIKNGIYLTPSNPATVHKILEFQQDIGASEGERSRWLMVESTSVAYHGYPISAKQFRKWLTEKRECCDERQAV